MKLLNCTECHDIVKLNPIAGAWRSCRCGKAKGCYMDEIQAVVVRPGRILAIDNNDYKSSLSDPATAIEYGKAFREIERSATRFPHARELAALSLSVGTHHRWWVVVADLKGSHVTIVKEEA